MECPTCQRTWPDDFIVCPHCAVSLVAKIAEDASGAVAQGTESTAAGQLGLAVGGNVGGDVLGAGARKQVYYQGEALKPDASLSPGVLHNLPNPDYEEFVGRQGELSNLQNLLSAERRAWVVVVDGIGGIGKSALALEAAHRYLDEYDGLPEKERFKAIIWVSAKTSMLTADGVEPRAGILRTLDDIYTAIAMTLDREEIIRVSAQEQDAAVRRALARQRTLLIVDNLESVDDDRVVAFLRELPRPTKAIVTTRSRINVAYPIRLTGMSREDALALIGKECKRRKVTLSEDQRELLFRRTGGVPLAIVWSVAQMSHRTDSAGRVDDVLRRLGHPTADITRYVFEGAMEQIRGKPPHRLMMALSLFADSASRDALGYVTDLPELDRDDALLELEQLSLVNREDGRYSMLAMTRTLASFELRVALDEEHLTHRWLDWLIQWGERYGEDLSLCTKNQELIEEEYDNLVAALEWSYDRRKWSEFLRLASALYDYMLGSNYFNPLEEILERVAKVMVDTGKESPQHLFRVGYYFWYSSRYDEAIPFLRRTVEVAREVNDLHTLGRGLDCLSQLASMYEETERARELASEVLEISRQANDRHLEFLGNYRFARLFWNESELDKSESWIAKGRRIAVEEGWDRVLAWVALFEGKIAMHKEQWQQAEELLEDSKKQAIVMGEDALIALSEDYLSRLYVYTGRLKDASLSSKTAIRLYDKLGMQRLRERVVQRKDDRDEVSEAN